MYKILVSDKFSDAGLAVFRESSDIELDYRPGLSGDELFAAVAGADGLAIRSGTQVTRELLTAAKNLRVIGRAGVGVDNVDVPAATERGICVMNTPGGNTVTTGEHAIAMMLALARKIPQASARLKAGKWDKNRFQGTEICGKILGVIGLGRIGRVVAERALGLKMRVLVFDPYVTADAAVKLGLEKAELDEVLAKADFITIHVPKSKETENFVRAETIAKMKDGVRIINCARGGIVNENDLADAVKSGKVAGAALDVFAVEPITESPLFALENVIVTPHLGASTFEAQENVTIAVAEQMIDYLVNGVVANAVNVPSVAGETLRVLSPYLALAEKLGSMHAQLSYELPEEITITYGGDLSELPTEPVGIAALKGFCGKFADEPVNFVNARLIAEQQGVQVRETKETRGGDYTNYLALRVRYPNGNKRELTGTKFMEREIRLTRYDDLIINIEPEGNMLLIRNRDVPGVVAWVGKTLAEAQINIANMRLARDETASNAFRRRQAGETDVPDGHAMTIVTTDQEVPDDVREKMQENAAVISAKFVRL
ncbi:phosphoglycerate dehydrogenase [bacterium]|nr:phosphoglycerate dehydrogenase [bacterium]